jgi:uncharacterized protein (UPF0335 family)
MSVKHREWVLETKKPLVFHKIANTTDYLFVCCLHCKKGAINGLQRNNMYGIVNGTHSECVNKFSTYSSMYESIVPEVQTLLNNKWVEVPHQKHIKTGHSIKGIVKCIEPDNSVSQNQTPCGTPGLSEDMSSRILQMWGEGRRAIDEVDPDEETIEGKLTYILDRIARIEKQNRMLLSARNPELESYKKRISEMEDEAITIQEKNNSKYALLEKACWDKDVIINAQRTLLDNRLDG